MGEQLSDGGAAGRRPAHPDAPASHETGTRRELEALLAAAMRPAEVDGERERRAVAAFQAARDAGAHRARTRRRDDWRPRAPRRTVRSLRATLSLFFASLALGGAAFAAIGTTGSSTDSAGSPGDRGTSTPSSQAPVRPGTSAPTGADTPTDRPATAQDIEARCQAYDRVGGHGKALGATAWRQLTEAAGGAERVTAYCAEQLERAEAESRPGAQPSGLPSAETGAEPGAEKDNGRGRADKKD
ncbi:hypothetical protein [Streptomyces sp. NPDC003635]